METAGQTKGYPDKWVKKRKVYSMKVKRIELNNFKRFTHLIVEKLPESAKLVILVGPNGAGKSSFFEALNHFYKYSGYQEIGDYSYLTKTGNVNKYKNDEWFRLATKLVNVEFFKESFTNAVGTSDIKGHFYFRSAYRNEPDFQVESMHRQNNPTENIRLHSLIQNDQTVSSNYQRLIANSINGLYSENNNSRTVADLRDELVGKIQNAISRVFDDLTFSSLGDPLLNGNFYFTKGDTKNFSYKNLSAGEKSAFDLILDMVVSSKYYSNAIYCIDEPETHMHTKLQGKVLRELYALVPGDSQLWISTHSAGMLQEASDIEKECPGTVVFLDFGDRDFDDDQIIYPSQINKALTEKFYELAFGDFAKLILPKVIVFCEGDSNGGKRKNFDKTIYDTLFSDTHPEALFISAGACNDIENIEKTYGGVLNILLKNSKIIKIVDRDDRSDKEVEDLSKKGIRVLKERNLESYLLDDEIIQKICDINGKSEEYDSCIFEKQNALNCSISRGNAMDDYKSARGEIYNSLKKRLGLVKCGNNADSFLRDTLAPLITPETEVFKRLEREIFDER